MHSLLLIPDISGFTRFVSETESEHGRHIVAELLELLIDSDDLGLTVAEIEGDAILFYLKDSVPSIGRIMTVSERMFINFHTHLKDYESRRICRCGACTSAQSLSLKVVAHAGELQFIDVKGFSKPHGPDMIAIHRLMKNSVPHSEYLLITDAVATRAGEETFALPTWASFIKGSDSYEELGDIPYHYASMSELQHAIPEPETIDDYERMPNPISVETHVELPVAETYEHVSNLDVRLNWTKGVDTIEYDKERVNRIGTRHQCVIRGDLIDFETVSGDFGPNKLVYGERFLHPPIVKEAVLYTVLEAEGNGTRIRYEVHYRKKPFPAGLLTPLFRMGTKKQLRTLQADFGEYVRDLIVEKAQE